EADLATFMIGDEGAAVQRDPKLRLAVISAPVTWWMEFTEQWNPTSPWHDRRVRLAANLAIDRQALIEAERLGVGPLAGALSPSTLAFPLPLEPFPYTPAQARHLLAEAGYPNGFEAGDLNPIPPFFTLGEAVGNYLAAVGIRTNMRTMERATFLSTWRDKKLKGLIVTGSGAFGNAATRLDTYGVSTGAYAYGGPPDIDAPFQPQAPQPAP